MCDCKIQCPKLYAFPKSGISYLLNRMHAFANKLNEVFSFLKIRNSVKIVGKFSKVNNLIYSLAPISILNMKTLS